MIITIHRGAKEIGGSCVELASARARILLDFGLPLVDNAGRSFDSAILAGKSIKELEKSYVLPGVRGLYPGEDAGIDAILISHSHPDHYGLLSFAAKGIPVYLSEGANELIRISGMFTPVKAGKFEARAIKRGKSFSIKDIKITPYGVDHSAFDALAFLIEADGKRVFYSGDFRGHGRKSALFKQMVRNPPKDIDCLLMEGTSLGKKDCGRQDEVNVQRGIEDVLQRSGKVTFFFVSSQNIDRLVSAYKACRNTGATFVIDAYTAYVLEKVGGVARSGKIPQFNWPGVRVKFYDNHCKTITRGESLQALYRYHSAKIGFDEINKSSGKFLVLARGNSLFPKILDKLNNPRGAVIIYSMWEGYLNREFKDFCRSRGLLIEKVHTSGHATTGDLAGFARALDPKVLIPIHTFYPGQYKKLFGRVKMLKDKEPFEV